MDCLRNIILCFVLGMGMAAPAWGCTSAVISGKATPDGRPLLWKHRDTGFLKNHVVQVKGERFRFMAVVNSDDFHLRHEAWVGMNEAGFALMNTQSYNLVEVKDGEERGEANGRVIYRALEICATLQDFCHFLDTLAKPSMIEANFGVIDAQGGAAMFEVDYYHYKMFDANNPADAPYGYVARTNFSFSGQVNQGAGYVRYMEADRVLMLSSATGGITPQGIFDNLSRSFRNNVLNVDLRDGSHNHPQASGWFIDQDFIPRASTSCSVVVQGVLKDENPALSTMWTVLGYPPASIAVPLWMEGDMPKEVCLDATLGTSPLSHASLYLAKTQVFCYDQGMGTDRYLNWENLYNASGTGVMQRFAPYEREIFSLSLFNLERWRKAGKPDLNDMEELYGRVGELLRPLLQQASRK